MATLHLTILKSRRNQEGKLPVYVAVTHKRDVRYIITEYSIDDAFQFEKGQIVCHKNAKTTNLRLNYVLSGYKKALSNIENLSAYTCIQIRDILIGKRKADNHLTIKDIFEQRIAKLKKEGRVSYANMNEFTLIFFLDRMGDIALIALTPDVIERYLSSISSFREATKQYICVI